MHKHKKKIQKTELKEQESQTDLITGLDMTTMEQIINDSWGTERIVTTITIPYSLKKRLEALFPWMDANKSLVIAYMMQQGLARMLENGKNKV